MTSSLDATQEEILETLIEHACNKLNVAKETDLCHYLSTDQGRLHHFSYAKMKKSAPEELSTMLQQQIIECEHPKIAPSKQRKNRGSKRLTLKLENAQAIKIFKVLEAQGELELAELFRLEPDIKEIKKVVLQSIRSGHPDKELILQYLKLTS